VKKEKEQTLVITPEQVIGQRLAQGIEELIAGFGEGDIERVRAALSLLSDSENVPLDSRTCEMTRDLHARICALKNSLCASSITMTTTNIPDAARKLENVMQMTNEATHKLFGMIDQIEQLLTRNSEAFETLRAELAQTLPAEPRRSLDEYARHHAACHQTAKEVLQEMVIGQEVQDLSGQSLAKILKLVRGVETEISQLVQQFGVRVDPDPPASPETEPVAQDAVDAMLKQLGI
jgi:chemotaxis protein CheZ